MDTGTGGKIVQSCPTLKIDHGECVGDRMQAPSNTTGDTVRSWNDADDARLMNRPLLARRDRVHQSLAALPGRVELPGLEDIVPERFWAAAL